MRPGAARLAHITWQRLPGAGLWALGLGARIDWLGGLAPLRAAVQCVGTRLPVETGPGLSTGEFQPDPPPPAARREGCASSLSRPPPGRATVQKKPGLSLRG